MNYVLLKESRLSNLKKYLRHMYPEILSGHADEGIAAGLGFSQNAALKSLMKQHQEPFEIPFLDHLFLEKMNKFGYEHIDFSNFLTSRVDQKNQMVFDLIDIDFLMEMDATVDIPNDYNEWGDTVINEYTLYIASDQLESPIKRKIIKNHIWKEVIKTISSCNLSQYLPENYSDEFFIKCVNEIEKKQYHSVIALEIKCDIEKRKCSVQSFGLHDEYFRFEPHLVIMDINDYDTSNDHQMMARVAGDDLDPEWDDVRAWYIPPSERGEKFK